MFLVVFIPPSFASFELFVFNPESQTSRARFVKSVFEAECRKAGTSCKMQIFARAVDFEKISRVRKPDFAIVASYYYDFRKKLFKWSPVLSGYRGRTNSFKKALLSKGKPIGRVRYISAVSIGRDSINPVERKFINSIGKRRGKKKIFVAKVSKEIDAIMGLALSQVDGAIVTNKAFNILKRINPNAAGTLKKIRVLPAIQYPKIVSFPWTNGNLKKEIKTIVSTLKKNRKRGRLFFAFFGVTAFK